MCFPVKRSIIHGNCFKYTNTILYMMETAVYMVIAAVYMMISSRIVVIGSGVVMLIVSGISYMIETVPIRPWQGVERDIRGFYSNADHIRAWLCKGDGVVSIAVDTVYPESTGRIDAPPRNGAGLIVL
jgi:hypothetical protein